MKSGKLIGLGLGVVAVIFGATLWWFQTRAFYERIDGLTTITFQGVDIPIEEYEGIDAPTSPLKMRACFYVGTASFHSKYLATAATPLVAPNWFDCFDAKQIADDIATGKAWAFYAVVNEPDGFDRIIVIYEDNRAFMWRQLNEKYAD